MARGSFALGFLIGGFGGIAAGYFLSKNGQSEADLAMSSIDLTPPAIELKQPAKNPASTNSEAPASAKEAATKEE